MKLLLRVFFTAIVLFGVLGVSTTRATITYDLNISVNGTPPSENPPWLTAVLSNFTDTSNRVGLLLRMTATNLAPGEKVDSWAFKLNTSMTGDPTTQNLQFTQAGVNGSIGVKSISVSNGVETVAGSGNILSGFDILFNFNNGGSNAFEEGEEIFYFIHSASRTLTETDFFAQNPAGYYSGAHVIGISGGRGSGAIGAIAAVPEPGHSIFGVLLLGGLVWVERGRIRSFFRRGRQATA